MQQQGLSLERIKALAQERGDTLPSESVSTAEIKKVTGGIGEKAGRALGSIVSPFLGNVGAKAGEKVGEATGEAVSALSRFTGVEKLGQGLGYSLFQLTPEYKELKRMVESGQVSPQDFVEATTGNISSGEVIGSGIRTAATIASAGTFPQAGVAPTARTVLGGIGQGVIGGARTGALSGGIFGGAAGLAEGIEEGRDLGGIAAETVGQGVRGGVIGGAVGGALGGVLGGVQTALRNEQIRKAEALRILSQEPEMQTGSIKAPFASKTASEYKIDPVLKTAVKDNTFKTTLKNTGVLPDDLALVKASKSGDYQAYKDMIRIASDDNIFQVEPVNSRVGKTFLTRLTDIRSSQQAAGKEIDRIARESLSGKKVPQLSSAVSSFSDDLATRGVTVADDGSLNFTGSDFEDLTGVQRILNTAWRRANELGDDALKGHQLKRFLDTQLDYGKTAEGVSGTAENLLKGLRSSVDEAIDTADSAYNLANTQYSKAIKARDVVQRLLGRDFNIEADLAEARAGEVMQRVLGSSPSRALQALSDIERTAAELGYKYDDNVIAQIRFADMLEDITGAPSRSLGGQTERAIRRIITIPKQLQQVVPYADNLDEFLKDSLSKTPQERLNALAEYIDSLSK